MLCHHCQKSGHPSFYKSPVQVADSLSNRLPFSALSSQEANRTEVPRREADAQQRQQPEDVCV